MKQWIALLVCSAVLQMNAAEVKAGFIPYGIYAPDTIQQYKSVSIQNKSGRYVLKFVETKPQGNRPGEFQIRLREPTVYYSFSRPILGFIQMKVGKNSLEKLSPDFDSFKIWEKEDSAGIAVPLNFSGEKWIADFFMKAGSPLLWVRVTRQGNSSAAMDIRVSMVISGLIPQKWKGYDRRAETAKRTLKAGMSRQALTAEDKYMILYDEKITPGSEYKRAIGPCFVTWEQSPLTSSILNFEDSYQNSVDFIMKPDNNQFEFGIWESNTPRTLLQFKEYFTQFLPK